MLSVALSSGRTTDLLTVWQALFTTQLFLNFSKLLKFFYFIISDSIYLQLDSYFTGGQPQFVYYMFTRYTALKPSKTQFLQWITIFPNSYFSTTPARTPKRSSTRVRIATKKTKDYDSPIVKYWTIFARYVSNHLSDIFITVLYTLVLIAIFAERAYCK